jgi:putative transposase
MSRPTRESVGRLTRRGMSTRSILKSTAECYLWLAVDAEGEIVNVLVQSERNKRAALKLTRKLLKRYAFVPERLSTDDLRSYRAAVHVLAIEHCHQRGRWRNNRAEDSHRPT